MDKNTNYSGQPIVTALYFEIDHQDDLRKNRLKNQANLYFEWGVFVNFNALKIN